MPLELTPEERAALVDLISRAPLEPHVLYDALECSMRVRLENSRNGGLIIQALNRNGVSNYTIADELSNRFGRHISESTVRGWIDPPAKERP